MSATDAAMHEAIDAYLDASILLEQIVPGCVVDDLDGLTHIRYGRPRAGIDDEIIARDADPARVLSVIARHPEIAPAYLSMFTRLDSDWQIDDDAGLKRVARNLLMTYQLPDVAPFSDPTLKRLTGIEELKTLARVRGDDALDVEHVTDAIGVYALDIDGDPISSAVLIPSRHNIAVIEHVHTLVAYRRRGYGRWLLRALHAEAARMGIHQIVLGSNAAGRPLYTALGYVPLAYQDVYVVGG
jgi:GNAT superfamily N-acetyltransferase